MISRRSISSGSTCSRTIYRLIPYVVTPAFPRRRLRHYEVECLEVDGACGRDTKGNRFSYPTGLRVSNVNINIVQYKYCFYLCEKIGGYEICADT